LFHTDSISRQIGNQPLPAAPLILPLPAAGPAYYLASGCQARICLPDKLVNADPEPTEYLYFVARGDGSHVFSRTLNEHDRARRRVNSGR
jgi:hypothetical protein